MEKEPLIIERTYHASAETIWKALTDKECMKKWYFDLEEFIPEKGFEFRFSGGKDEDHQYLHICVVTEVEKGRKITYSWRYEGYPGISHVSFELFPEGGSTRLVLTHRGLDSFPPEVPDLARENFAEGWQQILGKNLKEYLDKQ